MIFVALSEAADKGELLLCDGGMCRFHRRRDGVVTIRELLVLPASRGSGLGRLLVGRVRSANPESPLLARCPVKLASNGFWERLGFCLVSTERGINLWRIG